MNTPTGFTFYYDSNKNNFLLTCLVVIRISLVLRFSCLRLEEKKGATLLLLPNRRLDVNHPHYVFFPSLNPNVLRSFWLCNECQVVFRLLIIGVLPPSHGASEFSCPKGSMAPHGTSLTLREFLAEEGDWCNHSENVECRLCRSCERFMQLFHSAFNELFVLGNLETPPLTATSSPPSHSGGRKV